MRAIAKLPAIGIACCLVQAAVFSMECAASSSDPAEMFRVLCERAVGAKAEKIDFSDLFSDVEQRRYQDGKYIAVRASGPLQAAFKDTYYVLLALSSDTVSRCEAFVDLDPSGFGARGLPLRVDQFNSKQSLVTAARDFISFTRPDPEQFLAEMKDTSALFHRQCWISANESISIFARLPHMPGTIGYELDLNSTPNFPPYLSIKTSPQKTEVSGEFSECPFDRIKYLDQIQVLIKDLGTRNGKY